MSDRIPPDGHPTRIMPTMREQHVIDLYAEGYSAGAIARETGWSAPSIYRFLRRGGVPLRWEPAVPRPHDGPRLLPDAALVARGPGAWDLDALLALAAARDAAVEREVAETLARTAARGEGERAAA
jgi:hypothetical protein